MLFGEGVSCRILCSIVSYLYVSCSGSITSVGEERANLSVIVYLLLCGSVRRGFLFLLVLGMGCILLLWHSLGLPYNYFELSYILTTAHCSQFLFPTCFKKFVKQTDQLLVIKFYHR